MSNPTGTPKNLTFNSLPIEERMETLRKAGRRSGMVRRDKRTARERLTMLLELAMRDGKGGTMNSPITGKPMSVGEAIDTAMIRKAVNGDVRAANAIYEIIGEKTVKAEVTGADGAPLIPPQKMSDEQLRAEIEKVAKSLGWECKP